MLLRKHIPKLRHLLDHLGGAAFHLEAAMLTAHHLAWLPTGAFAVIEDEGSRILHGELSKAFGTLLKAWDGKLLENNRVEGGDIYLPDPRMVYVVAIQQGGFEQFVLKKGEVANDIGLFARCLPVWPGGFKSEVQRRYDESVSAP